MPKNTQGKEVIKVALGIYKVEWKPLQYLGSLEDTELDFIEDFRSDDGTYLIDEQLIDEQVEAYQEEGKELPQEFINFLREKLKEEGEPFSISIG